MNDGIIEELIMQMAALEKRLEYIETVEKNVFSTVTVAGDLGTTGAFRISGSTELTLSANANGVITVTRSVHSVDTYDDQATGDLDTINGAATGDILILSAADGARTVNLIDNDDNLRLSADMPLNTVFDRIVLYFGGTNWFELARSNNG